jgi:hypothetical protein
MTRSTRPDKPTASLAQSTNVAANGRLALMIGLLTLAILAFGLVPILLQEGTRDWIAYQDAADRMRVGQPLYYFPAERPPNYYLYPPLGVALWAAVGSPERLLVLKLIALALVGALAVKVAPIANVRDRSVIAIGLATAALIAPANIHDLVLSNVMALYVGFVALVLARPGWLGAAPLGILCAAALKPVIGPFLLWMLIRRPADFTRVLVVAAGSSAICAIALGPERYVEYLAALPQMTVLSELPRGNAGLSQFSTAASIAGVVAAYAISVLAARRSSIWGSAAVAVAAGLLAQPTLGFNYAGLLIPAVVALWISDRPAGLFAVVLVPPVAVVSPPLAAGIMILAAFRRALIGNRLFRIRANTEPV